MRPSKQVSSKTTVAEYVELWDVRHPRGSVDTVRHNRQMVRPLVEMFGHVELRYFKKGRAVLFRQHHPASVRYARTLFNDAMRDGAVSRNPFDRVSVPKGRGRKDIDALTVDEVDRLVWAVPDVYDGEFAARLQAAIQVAAYTGMRMFEQCDLWPADVDLGRWIVTVRRQKGGGAREVFVPKPARTALADAVLDAGSGRLFRPHSAPKWTRNTLAMRFKPVVRKADLDCTWHELRHFCASWMIDRGAQPIDVAIQLHGHTNVSTVLEYYVHASRKEAFERLEELCV